ncbi:Hypothetical predicted protein [Olea europaea subsp. europaea]|uniref:Pre-mRNA-splicing factor SYF2 n=1 Tax=Olea europaea subsp. europaea TaxID=158383 RepID=A0A8S0VEU5_OLEEU|nr:Hypothetical predicted protein [Olea europaea subsp. europaea]
MAKEGRVHPDCRNTSNPYHGCSEYCFKIIAESKKKMNNDTGMRAIKDSDQANAVAILDQEEKHEIDGEGGDSGGEADTDGEDNTEKDFKNLTGKQKRLFELRLKMNEARKANRTAMSQNIKKWEKEPAPAGWDVFNQRTLYNAYKKRTKNIDVDLEGYSKMKESDPEFYREASSLQYGKAPKISEEKIDKMVKELKDKEEKARSFSRRRKYREEKDIDSINDRNEHFNKKIERAFGKYTLEIKNNLERGTTLPD